MSMLRRALTGACATALLTGTLLAGTAAPAAAEHSSFCPQATSTRLLTANNGQYKVWLYKATAYNGSDEYHLCYAASPQAAGDIVIRTGITGSPYPVIGYSASDPNCPNFFTVQDPIQLVTEMGLGGTPYSFCFGVSDNEAVRVSFGLPTIWAAPSPELWIDKNTLLADTYCDLVDDYQCDYYYDSAIRVV